MQFTAIVAASLLALAAAQTVENPQPAAAIYDNPVGKHYTCKFEGKGGVIGSLTFTAGSGGKGVDIAVKLSGFVGEVGPFGYHIHDQPVPADGNCTGAKAHLDPYGRGQETPCDKTKPETCQVGDLSGKHGKIPAPTYGAVMFDASYNDLYASTKEGIGAFLGNRSIVIHRNDTTRLACANIVLESGESEHPTASPSSTYPTSNSTNGTISGTPAKPTTDLFTGSAATIGVSSVIAVGGLLAGFMMTL